MSNATPARRGHGLASVRGANAASGSASRSSVAGRDAIESLGRVVGEANDDSAPFGQERQTRRTARAEAARGSERAKTVRSIAIAVIIAVGAGYGFDNWNRAQTRQAEAFAQTVISQTDADASVRRALLHAMRESGNPGATACAYVLGEVSLANRRPNDFEAKLCGVKE